MLLLYTFQQGESQDPKTSNLSLDGLVYDGDDRLVWLPVQVFRSQANHAHIEARSAQSTKCHDRVTFSQLQSPLKTRISALEKYLNAVLPYFSSSLVA
jgi:hypothetical protein